MDSPADLPAPPLLPHDPAISQGAEFGIRVLARLIDVVVTLFLGVATGICVGIICAILAATDRLAPGWENYAELPTGRALALGLLSALLYQTFCEGIGSVSLGKLICGLRVMQTDGRPCTMTAALERNIAYLWDSLFFGLVGLQSMKKSSLQQRYGDHWAKTIVVKRAKTPHLPPLVGWKVTVGILLGSFVWAALTGSLQFIHILNNAGTTP